MPVGAEVVTGLLASIIYDGLKRPLKGFIDGANRRRAINRALLATPSAPAVSEHVQNLPIEDVQRIIAHDHGVYTDNVASFLQDIDRSAIPDALKHFAFCGYDASEAFPAFELLYKSHEPLPFDAPTLFNAINTAITTRIQQSVIDKTLFESSTAQHEEIKNALGAISACLQNATKIGSPLTSEEIKYLKEKIAKGIESANRTINVETTQGTRKVPVNRLVIPARLDPIPDDLELPKPHRESSYERPASISYINFRRTFSRAVILGDPGGGKSTLTQLLCYDLARQAILSISNPGYSGFDSRDMKIPLRIILRTLDKRRQQDPSYQIFDYIIDELRVYCDNDATIATRFLRQILTLGQAVLLFDGLDEILEIGARRDMAGMIEAFSSTYASCSALVTSRIVGYTDAPLNSDFQVFTLSRFNSDEIRRFAERLIRAISGIVAADSKLKANEFIAQTNTNAEDLRENPLLLGLMVYIFYSRGEVPNNRPEIYKECSILMFEKWDQRRDIRFDFPHDFDLLDLFGFLATQIFGSAETEDGVSERWLMDKIKGYFEGWYQDKTRAFGAAKVLVEFITGRAWVMCEIGPGVFKFTHRTFLEYFFAKRIEEESGSVDGLVYGKLAGKVTNAQWDVVSHLALQIATFRSGPKSTQAIETLLKIGTETTLSPEEEINFLTFFSKSLSYLLVPESLFLKAAEHIVKRCIYVGCTSGLDVMGIVYILIETSRAKARSVKDVIFGIFSPILGAGPSRERSYLIYFMGAPFNVYRSHNTSLIDDGLVWEYFSETRTKLEATQYELATKHIGEARNYIFLYGKRVPEFYKLYGIKLLFCPMSKLVPLAISNLGYRVVYDCISSLSGVNSFDGNGVIEDRAEAGLLLEGVTDDLYNHWTSGTLGEVIQFHGDDTVSALYERLMSYTRYITLKRKGIRIRHYIARVMFFYYLVRGDSIFADSSKRVRSLFIVTLKLLMDAIVDDKFVVALARIVQRNLNGGEALLEFPEAK